MAAKTKYLVVSEANIWPCPYVLMRHIENDDGSIDVRVWLQYQRTWSISGTGCLAFKEHKEFDSLGEAFDFMIHMSKATNRLEATTKYLNSVREYLDYCIEEAFIRSDKSM